MGPSIKLLEPQRRWGFVAGMGQGVAMGGADRGGRSRPRLVFIRLVFLPGASGQPRPSPASPGPSSDLQSLQSFCRSGRGGATAGPKGLRGGWRRCLLDYVAFARCWFATACLCTARHGTARHGQGHPEKVGLHWEIRATSLGATRVGHVPPCPTRTHRMLATRGPAESTGPDRTLADPQPAPSLCTT